VNKKVVVEVAFILILGFLGIYDGIRLTKVKLLNPDPVGPGWYLIAASGLLLFCGLLYLVLPQTRKILMERAVKKVSRSLSIGPAGWLVIVLIGYTIATPLAGYTLASAAFFILTLHFSGVKSWPRSVMYGVVFTVLFRVVFTEVAGISFP
jgi:hypothetical protein